MEFCAFCKSVMQKKIEGEFVKFQCPCGHNKDGSPSDYEIFRSVHSIVSVEKYGKIIEEATESRVNAKMLNDHPCPKCGRDYHTLVRVGQAEDAYRLCDCGELIIMGEESQNSIQQ